MRAPAPVSRGEMLEILFLVWFVRKLAAMARGKGRSGGWGWLGVLFWVGGEFFGFVAGTAADAGMGAYLLALACAAIGASIAYAIVRSLGPSEMLKASYETGAPAAMPAGPYDLRNPYSPPRT